MPPPPTIKTCGDEAAVIGGSCHGRGASSVVVLVALLPAREVAASRCDGILVLLGLTFGERALADGLGLVVLAFLALGEVAVPVLVGVVLALSLGERSLVFLVLTTFDSAE